MNEDSLDVIGSPAGPSNTQQNQNSDDVYQNMSNVRNVVLGTRQNIGDGGIGARVIRNCNDWKWGKQVSFLWFVYKLIFNEFFSGRR